MTNSDDSNVLAATLPAKAPSSVNSAKKTLRLFAPGPENSDVAGCEPKAESSEKPDKTVRSEDEVPKIAATTRSNKKHDRRVMKPGFRAKILSQLSEALGVSRTEDLPKIFLAERVVPMKIGIADDLLARYPNAQDRKIVKKALGFLVRSLNYSNAVIEEERRFDLDLNPVYDEAGEITDQSRLDAQNNIKNALAKLKKKRSIPAGGEMTP
jgi:hypothetical protein